MWILILCAVAVMVGLDLGGLLPKDSVGGPLTLLFVVLIAILVLALYEAFARRRGVIGWILNIIIAFIGGFIAMNLFAMMMDLLIPLLPLTGPLATSDHPARYIASGSMMLFSLLGALLALKAADRFR